jgi:hypothetical protein
MLTSRRQVRRRRAESKKSKKRSDSSHGSSSKNPKESGAKHTISLNHHTAIGPHFVDEATGISTIGDDTQYDSEASSTPTENARIDNTALIDFAVTSDDPAPESPSPSQHRKGLSKKNRAPKKQLQLDNVKNDSSKTSSESRRRMQGLGTRYVNRQV